MQRGGPFLVGGWTASLRLGKIVSGYPLPNLSSPRLRPGATRKHDQPAPPRALICAGVKSSTMFWGTPLERDVQVNLSILQSE